MITHPEWIKSPFGADWLFGWTLRESLLVGWEGIRKFLSFSRGSEWETLSLWSDREITISREQRLLIQIPSVLQH